MSLAYGLTANGPTIDPVIAFADSQLFGGSAVLRDGQAAVLRDWFARRQESRTVVRLPAGSGKTLIGLLIADSSRRELDKPTIYVCENHDQVAQVGREAECFWSAP